MLLKGSRHINEELKLKKGDRFRVHCTEDTDYIDDAGVMINLTGEWLTVHSVSSKKEGREDYHGSRVFGYLHTSVYGEHPDFPDADEYCWYWNHMDAIETAGVPHGLLMLEQELPNL